MIISLIAAMTPARVIGINNQLPWQMPEDLKHFKALTLHKPIVMGRKTYQSIARPLPHRRNLVITRDKNFVAEGCEIFHSLDTALAGLEKEPEVCIIGGTEIFSQTLPIAHKIYLTLIHAALDGDTYFPEWDLKKWREISREDYLADEKNPYDYSFMVLSSL